MTTTNRPTVEVPAWLNVDAIFKNGELEPIPSITTGARTLLATVAEFNRQCMPAIQRYYAATEGLSLDEALPVVEEVTGMEAAQELLALAVVILGETYVGGPLVTDSYATRLAARHAPLVAGVTRFNKGLDGETFPFPYAGSDDA